MANKIASIRASQITESGIVKGANALDCPLWADARNVIFRDGGPQKTSGYVTVATSTGGGIIRGMDASQDEAQSQRVFFGDQTGLWMMDFTAFIPPTKIASGLTGYTDETSDHPATVWSFCRYGNWEICTNGQNPVKVWKTGTSAGNLTGTTFTKAEIVKQSRGYVLAFNTSNGGNYIEWSDTDNPESWTPTSTNAAGNIQLRDMDGTIKAVCSLGEQFLVFGKNRAYSLSYAGEPYIWVYQPALQGIGACSKQAVVEVNRNVYGMDSSGFWVTDGVTYQRIGSLAIWDYVKGAVNGGQLSKVCATYDANSETVYWSISGGGEPTYTVGYTIPTQAWTICDFGRSSFVPQMGVFQFPMAASGNKIYYQFWPSTWDADTSVGMTAYVQTKPMDLGEPRAWKYLEAIEVQFRKLTGSATLYIGWQASLDDAITWDAGTTLDDGYEVVYTQVSGRFISLKLASTAAGATWAISGFDLFGELGGTV